MFLMLFNFPFVVIQETNTYKQTLIIIGEHPRLRHRVRFRPHRAPSGARGVRAGGDGEVLVPAGDVRARVGAGSAPHRVTSRFGERLFE